MDMTVAGLFLDTQSAVRAVEALVRRGYARESISVVARDSADAGEMQDEMEEAEEHPPGEQTIDDTIVGGILGGILGLAAGIVLPGALIVIGPIAGLVGGAAFGATTGAVVGAIRDLGVSAEDAHGYLTSIDAGAVLVAVHTDERTSQRTADILSDFGATDVHIVERQA